MVSWIFSRKISKNIFEFFITFYLFCLKSEGNQKFKIKLNSMQGGQNVRIVRIDFFLTLKLYGLYGLYGFVFKLYGLYGFYPGKYTVYFDILL